MKKNYLLFSFIVFSILGVYSQEDIAPNVVVNSQTNAFTTFSPSATSFLYDAGVIIGAPGNAGVVFVNNQFWVSAWASNNIHILSSTGAFVETIQVAGLTGTRSMTTDGTNVYCGTASNFIYTVNASTKMLTSTINITTTSNATARFCAYDASLNSGAGGFWIANFNTDIAAVSMTGSQLSVIPAATHTLTGMYGAAVDGSGLLYVYHQAVTPSDDVISSINLATGLPTGMVYDFYTNDAAPAGATSSLAGGLSISTTVVPGQTTLIGLSQATPSNFLFGLNINTLSNDKVESLSKFKLYPNPVNDILTLSSESLTISNIKIYNLLGQLIIEKRINSLVDTIDVSTIQSGTYSILIESNDSKEFFKIIKK